MENLNHPLCFEGGHAVDPLWVKEYLIPLREVNLRTLYFSSLTVEKGSLKILLNLRNSDI